MTEKEICRKIRIRFQNLHSQMNIRPNQVTGQMDPSYVHVGKPLLLAPISTNDGNNDNDYTVIRKKDILFGVQRHPGNRNYYQYTYDHMEEYLKITKSIDRKTFFTDVANYFIQKDY
jgi:hypothetical protein